MSRRAIRAAIALYPRQWRKRYGTELEDLTLDAIGHGHSTSAVILVDLMRGAVTQRLLAVRGHPATVPVVAALAIGTLAISQLSHPGAAPVSTWQPAITAPAQPPSSRLSTFALTRFIGSITVTVAPISGAAVSVRGAPADVVINPQSGQTLSISQRSPAVRAASGARGLRRPR